MKEDGYEFRGMTWVLVETLECIVVSIYLLSFLYIGILARVSKRRSPHVAACVGGGELPASPTRRLALSSIPRSNINNIGFCL